MGYPPPAAMRHADPPGSLGQAMQFVAAATDMNALVATVAEAYRLTVSLERDVLAIKAHYRHLEQTDRQLHDQIMAALDHRFTERASQIGFIERMAAQFIDRGEYDAAQSIITQMMGLLQQSPVDEAFSQRAR